MLPAEFVEIFKEIKSQEENKKLVLKQRKQKQNEKLSGKIYGMFDRKVRSKTFVRGLVNQGIKPGNWFPFVLPRKVQLNYDLMQELVAIFKTFGWEIKDWSKTDNTIFFICPG